MHNDYLYEYAVIRYVPRVEREEFINVGLIMMCKRKRWLRVQLHLEPARLSLFDCAMSCEEIEHQLSSFTGIAQGLDGAGPVATFEPEERFRWLTAVRSSCVQTSRPHCGLTADLDMTFDRLMKELVL